MFESDDLDEVLSQLDLPELQKNVNDAIMTNQNEAMNKNIKPKQLQNEHNIVPVISPNSSDSLDFNEKHVWQSTKRKIINSCFDYKKKRKFPGPAGLLSETFKEHEDTFGHIVILSEDIDQEIEENCSREDLFESPLWKYLVRDIAKWNLGAIDTIYTIKEQNSRSNLRWKKAHIITGFVENIDRSEINPLIVLRDSTGCIKCTLHRDAWSIFSPYIMTEHCAMIIYKPTVLILGKSLKKYYLNITLRNIIGVYSKVFMINETNYKPLPCDYVTHCEDDVVIVKKEPSTQHFGPNCTTVEESLVDESELDSLENIFSSDEF